MAQIEFRDVSIEFPIFNATGRSLTSKLLELATGGGVNDQTIKIWNVASGSMINELNCGSQVTNIMYSKSTNELISSHGF
jgi:WD40 repeat protein